MVYLLYMKDGGCPQLYMRLQQRLLYRPVLCEHCWTREFCIQFH